MDKNLVESIEQKYLNQIIKIVSNNDRIILGKLQCIDNLGNLYLIETVEVFDKNSDNYVSFDLYKNNKDHVFQFESAKNQYQLYNPCIVPLTEVKNVFILKN
jgi:small nuclear ribonucleoprotein (snRNP)-like protein